MSSSNRTTPTHPGLLNTPLKVFTFYMLLIFVTTLGLGAWVNDFTAQHCVATTGKTYQECNR